jgi:hypothetical protein
VLTRLDHLEELTGKTPTLRNLEETEELELIRIIDKKENI